MAADTTKNVIDIDLEKLEQEWIEHPKEVLKAQERMATAKKRNAEAEAALDLLRAEWDLKIRKKPVSYGLPVKPTEGAIKSRILLVKEVQKATNTILKLGYIIDKIKALTSALEHRKKALENAVYLWGAGYFSTPTTHKMSKKRPSREIGDD